MEEQQKIKPPKKPTRKYSGKRMGLKQLSQRVFNTIAIQDKELQLLLGDISAGFDAIFFGESGSGKSNLVAKVIKELVQATGERCDYVSYEEGHEATTQKTLIHKHNLLEELGNKMGVWDNLSFDDLVHVMGKNKSPKIWVIDSVQTSGLTIEQTKYIRQKFVLGKKKKIVLWISWSSGKNAKGALGESVQYWAHIKIFVKGKIAFPISNRFGGKKNYIIWEEGAKDAWGTKLYNKHKKQ
jgi:hypothetical protein